MRRPFFTIGHSTRTLEEFVDLLKVAQVTLVVDVRTVPRSRTNPQYNTDALPLSLAPFQIGYELISELGGLRGKAKLISPELNGFWQNRSFHNYADYATTEQFQKGFQHLLDLGSKQRCAIMCSEAVWWRCHRRIVADYLIAHGENVFHLMDHDKIEPAKLNQGAHIQPSGLVFYPA